MQNKKRVLIFCMAYYPETVGGAEIAVKNLTDNMSDDLEFHLICNRYNSKLPRKERIGKVNVYRIGLTTRSPSTSDIARFPLSLNKFIYQILAPLRAVLLFRKVKFDHVWAVMAHSAGIPGVITKWLRPKTHFVLTLQEGDPLDEIERSYKFIWPVFSSAFKKADSVQVISSFLGDWASRMGHKKPTILLPNGVDLNAFNREVQSERVRSIRRDLGFTSDDVLLVTSSRLVKKNAIGDIMKALSILPKRFKLVVIGSGPMEDELRELVQELELDDRVRFLGYLDHSELPDHMGSCDVFIRPSLSEGMGNAFIEAMAMKIPVIATAVGGIPDFLFHDPHPVHGKTGWTVATQSPDEIKSRVLEIEADSEKTNLVIKNAYRLARSKYDWIKIGKEFENRLFN